MSSITDRECASDSGVMGGSVTAVPVATAMRAASVAAASIDADGVGDLSEPRAKYSVMLCS